MVARDIVLTKLGWLFSLFQIFYLKKDKTFRALYSLNAGVGNDPRDRKFNIKRQAEMYDTNGKYQKLWLQKVLF